MDRGDDLDGKVIRHPKSKGVESSGGGNPPKFDRGEIDQSIDQAVAKRKRLGDVAIEFVVAVPIWLWLLIAGVLFGLAKTMEYFTNRFAGHMFAEAEMNPTQNSLDMILSWNRLAHFLNGFFYSFMGLAGLILLVVIVHMIRKYLWLKG